MLPGLTSSDSLLLSERADYGDYVDDGIEHIDSFPLKGDLYLKEVSIFDNDNTILDYHLVMYNILLGG